MTAVPAGRTLERVVARLEELVLDEFEPGGQLPSELQLAADCGVSRLTIREALKVLAGRGLVELSRGRRPIVREPDSSVLSGYMAVAVRRDPRALMELVEIREALEVLSVTLAAGAASKASVGAIEATLEAMVAAASVDSPEGENAYHDADVSFHEALALASGNRMLAFLLEGLEDSLRRSFERSFEGHRARGRSIDDVLDAHRSILDRIRHSDSRGAAKAMRAHLQGAKRDLRAALRRPSRTT